MGISLYRITATLTAETPLHIGSGVRTGVIKHSRPYIPGSTIRGAVGTVILRSACRLDKPMIEHEMCSHFDECLYVRLFGEEFGRASNLFFRYAYPLHLACGGVYYPSAKTIYTCRRPQCGRVYDSFTPPEKCGCDGSIKPYRGFRCKSCGHLITSPIGMSRITMTALDRERGSAAQIPGGEEAVGTLHTIEVVERGSKFALELLIHRRLEGELKIVEEALVKGLPDEGIGGGKSRGFGKVRVENLQVSAVSEEEVRERAELIDTRSFSVRLLSPLLLDGQLLEPGTLLEGARRAYTLIFQEGKPKLPELRLTGRRISYEAFSGWSLKEQRRRRIEAALSSGSVFQFECGEKDETLALALASLEHYSMGGYKPHGCGHLIVEPARSGGGEM
ncbi:MAG: RAMP superfamily CRISPR-associated protein [Candidatus Bathyarchaeia archaeon]